MKDILKLIINKIGTGTKEDDEKLKWIAEVILEGMDQKPKPAKSEPQPQKKPAKKAPTKKAAPKKTIDYPKAEALRKAGWPVKKIADELGCAEQTLYKHFQESLSAQIKEQAKGQQAQK